MRAGILCYNWVMATQPREPSEEAHKITYLRLSITDKCDLGCAYCAPYRASVLHADSILTVSEIAILVRAFAHNGVTKVRLTGGEPLLREDVVEVVRRVVDTPGITTVGITTNGIWLELMAKDLAKAGLQRINVSVDSLDHETFRKITGQDVLDAVFRGIEAALGCGFEQVKLNVVVMRGVNEMEIPAIADIARSLPVEVRFIEMMPLGHSTSQWQAMHFPAAEIRQALGDLEPLPYESGSSARRYRLADSQAVVGIISPMSEDFCGGCNRIRVTCCGRLKPCLRLPIEEDIRPLLGKPDLESRLNAMMSHLNRNKLSGLLASCSAIQAEAMCAVGG